MGVGGGVGGGVGWGWGVEGGEIARDLIKFAKIFQQPDMVSACYIYNMIKTVITSLLSFSFPCQ